MSPTVVSAPPDIGEFTGYASTWTVDGGPDRHGDTIRPGAYADVVKRINNGAVSIPIMAGERHADLSPTVAVGRIIEAREDNIGLWVRARFAPDEFSQTIRRKTLSGALSMSIGAVDVGWIPTATGKEIRSLDLIHVMLTSTPANRSAIIMTAKSMSINWASNWLAQKELAEKSAEKALLAEIFGEENPVSVRADTESTDDDRLAWRKFLRGVR